MFCHLLMAKFVQALTILSDQTCSSSVSSPVKHCFHSSMKSLSGSEMQSKSLTLQATT